MERGNNAVAEIKQAYPEASVQCIQLDLGSLASVRQCVETYKALDAPLDILINNAGDHC